LVQIEAAMPQAKFLRASCCSTAGSSAARFPAHRRPRLPAQCEGAFGLVLNRALGKTVGEMIIANLPAAQRIAALPRRPGPARRAEFSAHGQLHS